MVSIVLNLVVKFIILCRFPLHAGQVDCHRQIVVPFELVCYCAELVFLVISDFHDLNYFELKL